MSNLWERLLDNVSTWFLSQLPFHSFSIVSGSGLSPSSFWWVYTVASNSRLSAFYFKGEFSFRPHLSTYHRCGLGVFYTGFKERQTFPVVFHFDVQIAPHLASESCSGLSPFPCDMSPSLCEHILRADTTSCPAVADAPVLSLPGPKTRHCSKEC